MSKKCDLCGRSATKGASRSHSKIKTLQRQGINLQSKVIDGIKAKICTSCLRTLAKPKRVKTRRTAETPFVEKVVKPKVRKPKAKKKIVKK